MRELSMYPKMEGRRPETSRDAIRAFERKRGIELPQAYTKFLLATNGGVPVNSLFHVKGRPDDPIDNVQSFLGIGVPVPTSELAYAYDIYSGGIPPEIVPIANQDIGNYICLDLRGGAGRVVYWDHRHFWNTGEWREADLYDIADTFEEFLGSLIPATA